MATRTEPSFDNQPNKLRPAMDAVGAILAARDREEALTAAVTSVCEVLGDGVSAAITLANEKGELELLSHYAAGPREKMLRTAGPRADGVTAWVVEHGRAVFEDDVKNVEDLNHPHVRTKLPSVGAYACLPLQHEARVYGALFVLFEQPFVFDADAMALLKALEGLATRAIELTEKLRTSLAQTQVQASAYSQVSEQLRRTWQQTAPPDDLNETLNAILRQLDDEVFPHQEISAVVYVHKEEAGFSSGAAIGSLKDYMENKPPRAGGTAEYALNTGRSLFVGDVDNPPKDIPALDPEAHARRVKAFVNMPMVIGKGDAQIIIGIIIINLKRTFVFTEYVRNILGAFADQAAIILQNARVYRRRMREQRAIQAISSLTITRNVAETANEICQIAVQLSSSSYATLWTADSNRNVLIPAGHYIEPDSEWKVPEQPLVIGGDSLSSLAASTGESQYVHDIADESSPHFAHWHRNCTAAIAVPLIALDDLFGVLYVATMHKKGIDDEHQLFINRLAPHAAIALYNSRLIDENKRQQWIRDAAVLFQTNTSDVLPLREQVAQIRKELEQFGLNIGGMFIALYDPDSKEIRLPKVWENNELIDDSVKVEGHIYGPRRFKERMGLVDWVIEHDCALDIPDFNTWADKEQIDDEYRKGIRCCLAVPMYAEGKIVGVLGLRGYETTHMFNQHDRQFLELIAPYTATVIDNSEWPQAVAEIEQAQQFLRTISDFQQKVADIRSLHEQIWQIREELPGIGINNSGLFLATYDVSTKRIEFPEVYAHGQEVSEQEKSAGTVFGPRRLGEQAGLIDWMLEQELLEPLLIENMATWPHRGQIREDFRADIKCFLAAPMYRHEEVIGFLGLRNDKSPDLFDRRHLELFTALASYVAIIIENAQMYDDATGQLQQRIDGLEAVSEFQRRISGITTEDNARDVIYQEITEAIDKVAAVTQLYVAEFDHESQRISFAFKRHDDSAGIDQAIWQSRNLNSSHRGLTDRIIEAKQPLLISRDFKQWIDEHADAGEIEPFYGSGTQCYLGVPIMVGDDVLGVISVQNDKQENAFDGYHLNLLQIIARHAAVALENAKEYDVLDHQLKRRVEALTAINQFQDKISNLVPLQDELELIYTAAEEALSGLVDTDNMYIALYDKSTDLITFPAAYEDGKRVTPKTEKMPYGPRILGKRKGLTEWLINHKRPLLIESEFDQWVATQDDIEAYDMVTRCWLGTPIMRGDRVIGAIGLQNFEKEFVFNQNHQRLLATIAGQTGVAIDNAMQYSLREQELEAVSSFQQAIGSVESLETELDQIYTAAEEALSGLVDTDNMYIALYDKSTDLITFPAAYEDGKRVTQKKTIEGMPYGPRILGKRKGLTEWLINHKHPLLIESEFDQWVATQDDIEAYDMVTRCWLGTPIMRGDRVIGAIGLQNFEKEFVFNQRHMTLLGTIAGQAAVAIENAQLAEESRQRRLQLLPQISRQMTTTGYDSDSVLALIARTTHEVFDTDLSSVYLYDHHAGQFTSGVRAGSDGIVNQCTPDELPNPDGVAATIAKDQVARFIESDAERKGFAKRFNIQAYAGLPLIITESDSDPVTIGVFFANFRSEHHFTDDEKEILEHLANQAAVAIGFEAAMAAVLANEQWEALGQATAALQHRINSTIALAIPVIMRLQYRYGDDPETVDMLETIERNTRYALQIFKRLKRVLGSGDRFDTGSVNGLLRKAIEECVDKGFDPPVLFDVRSSDDSLSVTQPVYESKQDPIEIGLTFEPGTQLPLTSLRAESMQEVLHILIENAIKSIVKKEPPTNGQIQISSRFLDDVNQPDSARGTIEITVTDNGIGIPNEKLERLIDEIVPRRDFMEGAGMGLWLSGIILRNHRGKITAHSDGTGKGATFTIRLPVLPTAPVSASHLFGQVQDNNESEQAGS